MEKTQKLAEIAQQVNVCQRCRLYQQATKAVPGEGNPATKLVFIGEGPGYYEDQSGRPFVGQAGKLLEKNLNAIGLKREDVFIGNVVKHRPPENRDPLPDEIEACSLWLDQQLEVIQPEIIVTLGRFSMAKFLPEVFISKVHGQPRFVNWQGRQITLMPMYHPAAALRNSNVLRVFEEDFKKINDLLKNLKDEEDDNPGNGSDTGGSEQLGIF